MQIIVFRNCFFVSVSLSSSFVFLNFFCIVFQISFRSFCLFMLIIFVVVVVVVVLISCFKMLLQELS